MSLNGRRFNASDLEVVPNPAWFYDSNDLPLSLGNYVRLNSGGPIMMVVDHGGPAIVFAWQDHLGKVCEHSFPVACVHAPRFARQRRKRRASRLKLGSVSLRPV